GGCDRAASSRDCGCWPGDPCDGGRVGDGTRGLRRATPSGERDRSSPFRVGGNGSAMTDLGVVLEVGIGVVFVFLLLSLVTSTLTEWVAGIFALRSKTLATGIRELLNDPEGKGLAQAIYDHPLIKGLTRD